MALWGQWHIDLLVTVTSLNSRAGGHLAPRGRGRSPVGWEQAR
jgi:hypothetical protein